MRSTTNAAPKLFSKKRGEEGEADAEELVQREGAHATATVPGAGKVGPDGFRPAKLFSIDRVFRNETMDATHLAEFHQVEGVVADRGLTLADLIGRLHTSSPWHCDGADARSGRVHAGFLQEDGPREHSLQAGLQPVHRSRSSRCSSKDLVF